MKTDKIVLALLFNGISAISLTQQPNQLSQSVTRAAAMGEQLKAMSDDQIVSLMQQQIKDAKDGDAKPEEKKDGAKPEEKKDAKKAASPSEAEAKDAEMKQVEGALSRRILDRLAGGYGPYSAYPWAGSPLLDRVAAVHAYHDMVLGYEAANNIYGYLNPTLGDVKKVLDIVTDTTGMVAGKAGVPVPANPLPYTGKVGAEVASVQEIIKTRALENASAGKTIASAAGTAGAAATKADAAPKDAGLLQLEGVPVLVSPKLLKNEMGTVDLRLRDVIMEGVNGYDFVQLEDDVNRPEDQTVLQVNGVPVLVNPKLLKNEMGTTDLRLRDQIIDGVNGYDYVQTEATGVPVFVNPESMIAEMGGNQMASASLGQKLLIGPDDVSVAQHKADNFVFPDNVTLMVNGVLETVSAPADSSNIQLSNPVNNPPYNNWSVNQPSVPHDFGDEGKQDLGVRNIIIDGVNGYDFVQLGNPVNNPPYNNWSVNQPSVPHDFGDEGKQDLGVRNIIIDGVNGYDFVQTHGI